ncbi:WG repeat-containing protein [Inediibacterium massiliense]|uniref:WG repeat-containing protein n=1 Tax=Inediibacterium massiliense TaxID=1658111 RepID=UPI0006B5A3B7|nr:WG repeat-containing protein [Inediibacterium massiliense]
MNCRKYISNIILTIFLITLTGCSSVTSTAIELPEIKEAQLSYPANIEDLYILPINENRVIVYDYDTELSGIYTTEGEEIVAPKSMYPYNCENGYVLVGENKKEDAHLYDTDPDVYQTFKLINVNGDEIKKLDHRITGICFSKLSLTLVKTPVYSFESNRKFGLYNYKGEIIHPSTIDSAPITLGEGFIGFTENDQWGCLDMSGNVVIQPQYDQIYNFSNNMTRVCKDGKFGIINKKNDFILPLKFDFLDPFEKDYLYSRYAIKNKNSESQDNDMKYGIINKDGNIVVEAKYDQIRLYDDGYIFCTNEKEGFQSFNKDIYIPAIYDSIEICKNNKKFFNVKKGEEEGVINSKNQIIIPFAKQFICPIYKGFLIEKNGKTSIFNKEGKFIMDTKYTFESRVHPTITDFCEPVVLNNKWGLINREEETLIEPKYDYLTVWDNDNIIVKLKDKYGVVNMRGQLLIPIEYDLITPILNKDESVKTLFLFKDNKSYYCNR